VVAALVGVATAASDVMAASRPPATKKPQESICGLCGVMFPELPKLVLTAQD
jgi:hypothetical protein